MQENANEIQVKLFEKPQRKGKGKGKGKRSAVEPTDNYALDVTEEVNCTIKSLYRARLPISAPKYKDLKRLCENGIIPKAYHFEYLNLPSSVNVPDIFPETDAEDGEDTDNESHKNDDDEFTQNCT
ncbi:unnamed protein product [Euphydryas editha]|uniref:Uncharacterized protein n=1 Tax=Euphydryas editha TaxID=104508 RepID=A0AAU9V1R9_EUPED|nr:unnamed protein product [Euphydryas editha]